MSSTFEPAMPVCFDVVMLVAGGFRRNLNTVAQLHMTCIKLSHFIIRYCWTKLWFSDSIYFFKEHHVKIMDLNNTCSSQMQEYISCRVYSLL